MKLLPSLGLAVAAVATCSAVGVLLQSVIAGAGLGFLLFIPPILVAALYGGYWAAVLATVLGGLSAEYFFLQPHFTFSWSADNLYPLLLYVLIGLGVAVLAGRLADARRDVNRRAREFDTLFRLTPIGIGVANDPGCNDISVNPAFAEMLRIDASANASLSAPTPSRPQFTVERNGALLSAEDLPLQVAARLGAEVKNVELDVVHADGTRLTLYEYAAPLFDDAGNVRGAIGAFLDITDLKRAEERLRRLVGDNERLYRQAQEANRLKDEFLATLSHELRTPLNALLGWIQLLKSGQLPEEKRQRAMAAIERSAQVQAQLTSDLLDISGVITGKLRLQIEPIRLSSIAEDVMESLGPMAQSKGVTCLQDVRVDDTLMMDPARIQQILNNLMTNAIKFTPKGGTVHLSACREGDEVVIQVRDTGIGIAESFLPHVFERFRQGESGTTRSIGGLGLGLSIVKELAERHGGQVRAASPGVDGGATFTVRLPARVPAPAEGTVPV